MSLSHQSCLPVPLRTAPRTPKHTPSAAHYGASTVCPHIRCIGVLRPPCRSVHQPPPLLTPLNLVSYRLRLSSDGLTPLLPRRSSPPPQVDHELSVPAVKLMLLSCAAHVGTAWCQLLLADRLSGAAKASLRWGALLCAVAFNFVVGAAVFYSCILLT